MKRILVLISLALFLTSLTASAASVTYHSYVMNDGHNNPVWAATSFNGTFLLPEFNPALGVLTGATLTYTLHYQNVNASVNNFGDATEFYAVQGQLASVLSGSKINTLFYVNNLYNTPGWPAGGPGAALPIDPGDTIVLATNLSGSFTTHPTVKGGLTGLTGTGNLSFSLNVSNSSSNFLTGQAVWIQTALAYGQLDITYYFDPSNVPEPATMAFAGIGLLALGFLGRRLARR